MQDEVQVLSKGLYRHAQLERFVTVKNYIFMRQNGKKCLLLRFYNDTEYDVNAIYFTVVQLDAAGNELERTSVACEQLKFRAGKYYAVKNALIVRELCNDFKIIFDEVSAGRYSYFVKDGRAVAYFETASQRKAVNDGNVRFSESDAVCLSVKKKKRFRSKAAAWLAVLMLLILIALNVCRMYENLWKKYKQRYESDLHTATLDIDALDLE